MVNGTVAGEDVHTEQAGSRIACEMCRAIYLPTHLPMPTSSGNTTLATYHVLPREQTTDRPYSSLLCLHEIGEERGEPFGGWTTIGGLTVGKTALIPPPQYNGLTPRRTALPSPHFPTRSLHHSAPTRRTSNEHSGRAPLGKTAAHREMMEAVRSLKMEPSTSNIRSIVAVHDIFVPREHINEMQDKQRVSSAPRIVAGQ